MTVSAYKYMDEAFRKHDASYVKQLMQEQLIKWRRGSSITRIDRPTRLDKARRLGYKAKQGFVVVRVRIRKGGARKPRPVSGRRPRALGVIRFTRAKSLGKIAEERVAKKYRNLKVLNSYEVWSDGRHHWCEVIMLDPHHPAVRSSL